MNDPTVNDPELRPERSILVVGHTMGEALSRVEGVWADLRVAEEEFVRAKAP